MVLSFPSLFASSISMSVFILLLFFILKADYKLSHCGISSIYLLLLLIILRGYLPFDFYAVNLTQTITSQKILPAIQDVLQISVINYQSHSVPFISILIFIWVSVGSILLLRKLIGYLCYQKELKSYESCKIEEINSVFEKAQKNVFSNKTIRCRIAIYPKISTPAVFGFGNYTLLLPNINYTSEELFYIFVHELLHIKYRDFFIKFLADLIVSIHWWNPLITHYLPALVRHVQELHVDYAITHSLNKQKKLCYLNCLKKSIPSSSPNKLHESAYAINNISSEEKLKQRILSITSAHSKKTSVLVIIISFLLFVTSFTFVFEAFNIPRYDENGNRVFTNVEGNSYFVQNGGSYDLYLNGEYVYTTDTIISNFKDLPVYPANPD